MMRVVRIVYGSSKRIKNLKPNAINYHKVIIRESKKTDLHCLVKMWQSLDEWVKQCSPVPSRLTKSSDYHQYIIKWINRYFDNSDALLLVSEYGDTIAGFACAQIQYMPWYDLQRSGLIGPCYIKPSYRRYGIASKLVDRIEQWMVNKQIKAVDVIWDQGNLSAEKFWRTVGYSPIQVRAGKIV